MSKLQELRGRALELAEVLAGVVECDLPACPPARCYCRAQASALAKEYDFAPKNAPGSGLGWFWSDERQAQLTALFRAGGTYAAIGRAMGITEWQVKNGLRKLKLRRRDWGPGKPRPKP